VAVTTGVGVAVTTGVGVAVAIGVGVAVTTGVGVAVTTGVGLAVGVGVGVWPTGVADGVAVGTRVGGGGSPGSSTIRPKHSGTFAVNVSGEGPVKLTEPLAGSLGPA
jgi:hypothetical protein